MIDCFFTRGGSNSIKKTTLNSCDQGETMAAYAVVNDGDIATPVGEQYPYIAGGDFLTTFQNSSPSITPQNSTDMELEGEEYSQALTKNRARAMTPPAPHTTRPTRIDVPNELKKGKSVPLVKRETARIVELYLKRRSVSLSSADLSEDCRRVKRRNKKKEKRNHTISITSNISSDSNDHIFSTRASDSFCKELSKKDYDIENLDNIHKPIDLNREKSNSAPSTLRFKAKPCEQDFEKIKKMKEEGLLDPSDDLQIHVNTGKKKLKRRKTLINRARSLIGSPTAPRKERKDLDSKEKENRSKVHSEMKKTGFGKRLRKMLGIESKKHKQGSSESVSSPIANGINYTSSLESDRSSSTSPTTPSRDERRKIKKFPSFLRKKPRKDSPSNNDRCSPWQQSPLNEQNDKTTFSSATEFQYQDTRHQDVVRSISQPNHILASTVMQHPPPRSVSRPTSLNISSFSDPTRGFNVLHINSPLRPGIELRGGGQPAPRQAPLANFDDDLEVDGLSGDETNDKDASIDSVSIDMASSTTSVDEHEDMYREVAERLAAMGDGIVEGAVGGQGAASSSQPTTCTAEATVLQDISNMHMANTFSEDNVIHVVLDTTYQAFSTTVGNLVGNGQGWNQVALVLRFTKVAMHTARKIGRHATQIKNNSIEYISDHFAEWVGSQGGWESIIIDDSDEHDGSVIE
ncbi:uncharacterized protein LOC117124276 isoform X2 [Anneissia japonica]|uniref:uncharacterized protein LOC117124276 isoform X2 n=1 Tax=Anneissia japonica TaxID=1529436 RepID=UPI00142574B5|nr:uncharacterized protein LOC117124276 isoform X2 [Anneissia japonica]